MDSKTRIKEYDIAKGIGILLVIIGHNINESSDIRTLIYSFHMPLFFVLSGLVMKKENVESFRREQNLILSYIFYTTVYVLYDLLVRFMVLHSITARQLAWRIYQGASLFGVSVLWFIPTLVGAKLIADWLYRRLTKKSLLLIVCLIQYILSVLIANYISALNIHGTIYYPIVYVIRTNGMSAFVLLGKTFSNDLRVFLGNEGATKDIKRVHYFIVVGALLALFMAYSYTEQTDFHYMKVNNIIATLVTSIAGTIIVLEISKIIGRYMLFSRVLTFFGKHSLFIMVTSEYFKIQTLLQKLYENCSFESRTFAVVSLCLVEIILIKYVEPICNKLISKMSGVL